MGYLSLRNNVLFVDSVALLGQETDAAHFNNNASINAAE
jgi:hypothetical protein